MDQISIQYSSSENLEQKTQHLIRAAFWMAGPSFQENLKIMESLKEQAEKKLQEMKLLMEL